MLEALGAGLGGVGLASALAATEARAAGASAGAQGGHEVPKAARAKHVIVLFMGGGPSQIDLFDPKPLLKKLAGQRPAAVNLRTERATAGLYPSPFTFKRHGRNGVELSELVPGLASVIDDVCVIRSMYTFNPTHTPGRNLFHTGTVLATRPSMGAWVTYGLGSENQNLPSFVALGGGFGGGGAHTRAGFLPALHQGVSFPVDDPDPEKIIPKLRNKWLTPAEQRADLDVLSGLNREHLGRFGADPFLEGRIKSMEAAYRMQFEALDLFDIRKEAAPVLAEYGETPFANGCLLARRLVEAGVRFVHVEYTGGPDWDDHRDVNDKLKARLPHVDRASSALIRDLKRRGLLDETLVVWGGEFGRTPVSESGTGRDHNPYGFTTWVAGGGIQGGIAHGATDEFGFKAVQDRVSIHDLHATLLDRLGIDHTRLTYKYAGRDFRLTDVEGEVVRQILS
jgi:hypothetical protein